MSGAVEHTMPIIHVAGLEHQLPIKGSHAVANQQSFTLARMVSCQLIYM